jgi:hypothetical protein
MSKLPRSLKLEDPSLTREFARHRDAIRALQDLLLLDGRLLEDIDLTTATAQISHGLGRPARGYIVTKRDANAVIYDETSTRPEAELALRASATVTVSLWVF